MDETHATQRRCVTRSRYRRTRGHGVEERRDEAHVDDVAISRAQRRERHVLRARRRDAEDFNRVALDVLQEDCDEDGQQN